MAPPVAVVTGASSGIGLALTKYLLERKWNVVMADVNSPKDQLPNTLFIKTDISSWNQQSTLFSRAYSWHNRLDFIALNAGTDDRDDIFNTISPNSPPQNAPNMSTFNVNLFGTYYGIKLAAHYLSLPPNPGGKIIITASAAGIYPLEVVPQYAASKHALIGLVRSLAPQAHAKNITINAICPAMVSTNLPPPGLMENFSTEEITPMSTILKCFSELGKLEDDVDDEEWVRTGPNGETVEGNLDQLIYHQAPARPNDSYVNTKGIEAWKAAYKEKNIRHAMESSI